MHSMGEYPRHVPAMSGLDLPVVPVSRSAPRLRVTAAVCAGLAAFLVIFCSFLPLFSGEMSAGGQDLGITVTSWGFEVSEGEPFGAVPVSGYVLVAAAVLLLATALMCAMAALPTASRGAPRAAGLTAMAAAAFLTGTVWLIGMEVASLDESFRPIGLPEDEVTLETGSGAGLWLLVVAVALALAAVVVALRSTREPSAQEYAAQLQVDMATPRHGFPMPVVSGSYPVQQSYPAPPPPPPSPWAQQSQQGAQQSGQPSPEQGFQQAAEPRAERSFQQEAQPGAQPSAEQGFQQAAQPSGEQGFQQAAEPRTQPSPEQSGQPSAPPSPRQATQPDSPPHQSEQPVSASQPPDRPTEPQP